MGASDGSVGTSITILGSKSVNQVKQASALVGQQTPRMATSAHGPNHNNTSSEAKIKGWKFFLGQFIVGIMPYEVSTYNKVWSAFFFIKHVLINYWVRPESW